MLVWPNKSEYKFNFKKTDRLGTICDFHPRPLSPKARFLCKDWWVRQSHLPAFTASLTCEKGTASTAPCKAQPHKSELARSLAEPLLLQKCKSRYRIPLWGIQNGIDNNATCLLQVSVTATRSRRCWKILLVDGPIMEILSAMLKMRRQKKKKKKISIRAF